MVVVKIDQSQSKYSSHNRLDWSILTTTTIYNYAYNYDYCRIDLRPFHRAEIDNGMELVESTQRITSFRYFYYNFTVLILQFAK